MVIVWNFCKPTFQEKMAHANNEDPELTDPKEEAQMMILLVLLILKRIYSLCKFFSPVCRVERVQMWNWRIWLKSLFLQLIYQICQKTNQHTANILVIVVLFLTLYMLGKILKYFFISLRKWALTFQANCRLGRHFAWIVKAYFLGENKNISFFELVLQPSQHC